MSYNVICNYFTFVVKLIAILKHHRVQIFIKMFILTGTIEFNFNYDVIMKNVYIELFLELDVN